MHGRLRRRWRLRKRAMPRLQSGWHRGLVTTCSLGRPVCKRVCGGALLVQGCAARWCLAALA